MITAIRQKLTNFYRTTSPSLFKSDAVFPTALLHSSTSGEAHSAIHPTVYEFLVHNHNFSATSALEIASVVTHFRDPDRSNSVLSFLKETGFSISQLERTVKCWPPLLSADLDKTIKPKIKTFHDFGIAVNDAVDIISYYPWIFTRSVDNKLVPSLSLLTGLLGADELPKFLKSGWYLSGNLDETLIPNIELLKNCGVSMDQILWVMQRTPRFLLSKHDDMKKFVDKAETMGVDRSSKAFIHAVKVISGLSDETWELKLAALQEMGFSKDDITTTFRKYPHIFGLSSSTFKSKIGSLQVMGFSNTDIVSAFRKFPQVFSFTEETWKVKLRVLREVGFSEDDIVATLGKSPTLFGLSEESIRKAKEVLVANGKYDVSCIVRYPVSLTLSVEKRIKPRMQVLGLLESKKLIRSWPALSTFCCTSNKMFYERYVAPFGHEIGDSVLLWQKVVRT